MAHNDQLHGYAKRILKAQKFRDLDRSKENEKVKFEAAGQNIQPLEIYSYLLKNQHKIQAELDAEEQKKAGHA